MRIDGPGRLTFFEALLDLAASLDENSHSSTNLEFIQLAPHAIDTMRGFKKHLFDSRKKIFADVILIALSSNQQYICAVSTRYRSLSKKIF